jgi:hypothetical protein
MDNFAPGLREAILGLTDTLRVIVFFIAVVGLILQVHQARGDTESLTSPIVRAIIVVGLIATLPYWFEFAEKIFLSVADTVNSNYTLHPMQTAGRLRDSIADSGSEFSLRKIGQTVYLAFLFGSAKLVVTVASLLQLPFLILQYLLKLLCYLFLPVALALMMIPPLASLGARYIQQTLAVLAWPVGFAITELVAYHLLTAYGQNLAVAYDLTPGQIDGASYASLLGALLAAVWLIIGTVGTPFLMQMLLCSGSPLNHGGQSALQHFASVQQLALLVKSVKTGGLAAPALAAQAAGKGGPNGGAPGGPPMPPAPPPAAPTPPQPASPLAPDPTGDARAASALAVTQLPKPQTTI